MEDHRQRGTGDDKREQAGVADGQVSRRGFLKLAGVAGATIGLGAGMGGLLGACGEDTATTTTAGAAVETTSTTPGAETTTSVTAAVETGRKVLIGALSPITGSLASFGGPDKWIVTVVANALKDGVVCGDGKNHPVEILQMDTQSDPNRVSQVTQELIFQSKVDMCVASSSPDTVNPAADQCEANGVPFLANFVPWQPFYLGRGGTPDKPFTWTYMFHFGVEDAAECRVGMWDQVQTNKKVALLFPNDADGLAWSNAKTGLGQLLAKKGYTIAAQPEMYAQPAEDYTSQIAEFKKVGAEICTGLQIPSDFTNFWKQCQQQGYKPKILSISKALLFHETIQAVGDIGIGTSDHMVWHPTFPYKSALTGQTCQEFADQYEAETGKQWTEPLGQIGKYEWAIDVLKRWTNIDDKSLFPDVVKATKFECINGPVDFTLPVAAGTVRPVPNVCKIKIAGGQWAKAPEGSKFPYDIYICYGQDPNMPIGKPFEELKYS